MIIRAFDIQINEEAVLHLIDCKKDSPIHAEVEAEIRELREEAYRKIEAVALLEFGNVQECLYETSQESQALFCITSVGREISRWSTALFESGDCLKGMLVDAIADDYLFQMDRIIGDIVRQLCKERKAGVKKRMEAPQDISMQVQRTAWELTNAKANAGIDILESYMYDPVKTTCQVYLLDDCDGRYAVEHNCGSCPNTSCKLRTTASVSIAYEESKKDKSLLGRLRESGIYIGALCAGRGVCGKCAVRIKRGAPAPSKEEERFFSKGELERGHRLACTAYIEEDCEVELLHAAESGFQMEKGMTNEKQTVITAERNDCDVIIDIGTTTIVLLLIDSKTMNVIDSYAALNRQRSYGADVISRIEATNHGEGSSLRKLICQDLAHGIGYFKERQPVIIRRIVIAANTTMVHLLMGYPCGQLGTAPYTPYQIKKIAASSEELGLGGDVKAAVCILPGISTFVGGDIVAGLLEVGMDRKEKVSVFLDLGTNGELAVGNKEKILVASTAAGPAFEGGNIVHGVGSIKGAIDKVLIHHGKTTVGTIGEDAPIGLCGTGVIAVLYELLKNGIVDESGRLAEPYFETGYPVAYMESGDQILFTQKDIREVQLAKAAVRAGIETLLLRYGVDGSEIDACYIAGGFGTKLDRNKAVGIGLLPAFCMEKIKAVGNSCIKGLHRYAADGKADERVAHLIELSEEVLLAKDPFFHECFVEQMSFNSGDGESCCLSEPL